MRGSRVSQLPSITDRQSDKQMDGQMDRPKPICPLNFSEVGGIKMELFLEGENWIQEWKCLYCINPIKYLREATFYQTEMLFRA